MNVIIFVTASILLAAAWLMQVSLAVWETKAKEVTKVAIFSTVCFLATAASVIIMASIFEGIK